MRISIRVRIASVSDSGLFLNSASSDDALVYICIQQVLFGRGFR